MKLLTFILTSLLSTQTFAADFCVMGLKGTVTSNYIFKVSHPQNSDRTLTLLDANKNVEFSSKAENRFTQFNTTGYGVCSIAGQGTDANSGVQYKLEMKVAPHNKADCNQIDLPTSIEYLTLKVVPKGTTLGDDLTAYALSLTPCPN